MPAASLPDVSLDDKYARREGRALASGTQALVRLLLEKADHDRSVGRRTAGFVSGYRGSPLAGLDKEIARASRFLSERRIEFRPGINEELAATAVWGSQQTDLFEGAEVEGVFALWYGKGAGLDRACDAIRHGNAAGSARGGGVVVAIGDDHVAKSSSQTHACEAACADMRLPLLYPTDVDDAILLGLHAFEASRFSGSWIGLKILPELGDSTGPIELERRFSPAQPSHVAFPADGCHIRWPDTPVEQETRQQRYRLPAVQAYVRANGLDRATVRGPAAKLGLVAAGKAYLDVQEALRLLGLDQEAMDRFGIALYRVAMPWPLEPEGIREFAEGLDEVLVVEEKRPFIEAQLKEMLFGRPGHPSISGKHDPDGLPLLPSDGDFSPDLIAVAIVRRALTVRGDDSELRDKLDEAEARLRTAWSADASSVARKPFFCPGCPHNTSTRVPGGSRATGGIGCHAMAMWTGRDTSTWTQMGGEGVTWVGLTPFTREKHVFANLGDGTYYHSGSLAIRQAVASGVNVTYKVLFNRVVAMTGGQDVDGPLSVGALVAQLRAEGVKAVVVVSDDTAKVALAGELPSDVPLEHRDDLDAVQRRLREVPGVTAVVYDQACAAESRRRRKRGKAADPGRRAFINREVCEGCGDCSVASNCLAVEPAETELGHKRRINQTACNKDLSCVKGFCPSFVTVTGATLRKPKGMRDVLDGLLAGLPEPERPGLGTAPYRILVTGAGGTGVVTVGALLAMAAHLEGSGVGVLDMTGLAQKGGAVTSSVHLARNQAEIMALRITAGRADLVLACDLAVTAGKDALAAMARGRTRVVASGEVAPTADFVRDRDAVPAPAPMLRVVERRVGAGAVSCIDAVRLARDLVGEPATSNILLLGFAFQAGLVPLSAAAIENAIRINNAAVPENLAAFQWGRLLAHDQGRVLGLAPGASPALPADETLDALVERRAELLTRYQDSRYAHRYRALVRRVKDAEAAASGRPGPLSKAVAISASKLMAYKDEYEVARLYTDGSFADALRSEFDGDAKLRLHLAPPFLAKRDAVTGEPRKREFGPWVFPVFRVLARLKRLRGTPLDPFGFAAERRVERQLIRDYAALVDTVLARLTPEALPIAVELAELPQSIRGFGHVKTRSIEDAARRQAELLARFEASAPFPLAAE